VLFTQFFPSYVAAQTSNWDIIIDTSINEAAITGTLSNVHQGVEEVSGNIVLDNNTALWWKVYLSEVPDDKVDVDRSGLFFDGSENKYYFYLAPFGSSDSDALPTLPPSVTFHQVGSGLFFRADRTIVSGYGALILQVAEIALIAITGSGVPTSAVGLILNTLNAPPFLAIAEGLVETPINLWKVAEGLGGIAHSSLALNQLQYILAHLGVSMTISQIQQVFVFWSIVQELRIIYDTLTCPVADNVIFQAIESGDEPIIADISCFPSSGAVPLAVDFDASGSYSPQYPIVSYDWDFGDAEYGTGISETHTYYQAGDYAVTLTIVDDHGRQSIATRTIIVWPTGIQVAAGPEQFNLIFEAEESPAIVAYSWDFGDGSRSEDRVTANTYSSPGEYIVSLSLGLDTEDATQDWVSWIGRDVIKVLLEADSSPAGWSFAVDGYDDAPDTITVDGIIVEDADEVWTNTLVASTGLDLVAQSVTPRIILEYGDSISTLDLARSDDLDAAAITVSPRVIFEYADLSAPLMLAESAGLAQVVSVVAPRVAVEYSDVICHPDLQYPVGLDQFAALVKPRIVIEYADAAFHTVLVAANLDIFKLGHVEGHVQLQGRPAPPHATWITDLTVTFLQGEGLARTEDVTTDNEGKFSVADVAAGTYDIGVKGSHTLSRLEEDVVIESGTTNVDFGTLLEGDCDNNDMINISDFGILADAFGSLPASGNWDERADLNNNGQVNISDFGLLADNFGLLGEMV